MFGTAKVPKEAKKVGKITSLSLDYPVDGGSGLRRIPRRGRSGLHETPSDWTHLPTSGLAVFRPLYTL